MSLRVLLIDDDIRLSELLTEYLGPHGFSVVHAPDGGQGLAMFEGSVFDIILLDLMMPGIGGLEVCRRIRTRSNVPVLMLTARGDETDRVVGLEIGADDYIAKPFSPRELLARMRAVLRRAAPDAHADRIAIGDVEIDIEGRRVRLKGSDLELTAVEFDLLVALARRAGRVVPRDVLLSLSGRGDTVVGVRTVDVHISHLRSKLGPQGESALRIRTVRGQGYMLVKEAD